MKRALAAVCAAAACALALTAAANGYIESNEKAAQVRVGTTTSKDLEAMFGVPLRKLRFGQRDVWEYEVPDGGPTRAILSITLQGGVVRDVARIRIDAGPN
jgi:hypothetical protein